MLIQRNFTFVLDLLSTRAITATSANGFSTQPHGYWNEMRDHAGNITGLQLSWNWQGDPTKLRTAFFTEITDHGVTRECAKCVKCVKCAKCLNNARPEQG